MKKVLLILVCLSVLLMVSSSFAQSPRAGTSSEGKTSFTNLAATGLDVSGVPGYLELTNGDGEVFYIYVDPSGILMIASAVQVGLLSSPQTSTWQSGELGIGSEVGSQ